VLGEAILRLIALGHRRNAILQRDVGLPLAQARLLEMLVAQARKRCTPGPPDRLLRPDPHRHEESPGRGGADRAPAPRRRPPGDRHHADGSRAGVVLPLHRAPGHPADRGTAELATFIRLLYRFIAALDDAP
jgi:hypothetical protein